MMRKFIMFAMRIFIIGACAYAMYLHLWWLAYSGPDKWWSFEWDLYWVIAYVIIMAYVLLPRR